VNVARQQPKRTPELSADEKARLFSDILRNSRIIGHQMADWIRDTARVTQLVANSNTDLIPIFWIRLYGVLADVADQIDKVCDNPEHARQILATHEFAAALRVRNAITNIASVFNEDELVYLQYRRHVECHPLQNAYRIRVAGKAFQDSVHHRLLDKAMTVEDSDAACVRLFAKHGLSESRVAINFAQRVLQAVLELQLAAPAWFGLPVRLRR
jgi:hypothetical protein